ncbi:7212_t:CDS:1, partial [Gigaspora rosea]
GKNSRSANMSRQNSRSTSISISRQNSRSTNAVISEHEDESDLLYTSPQLEFSVFLRSMEMENEHKDEQNVLENTDLQLVLDTSQSGDNNIVIQHTAPLSAYFNKADQKLLQQFRYKMDKLEHTLCSTCNECFLSIILVKKECRCCFTKKNLSKKFLAENNIDPGKVPEELQKLTEIEEMLIAQVFPIMIVYRLRGRQHRYSGNVINFPQDVEEFTTQLPRHLFSLSVLIVRWQSERDPVAFRDFK